MSERRQDGRPSAPQRRVSASANRGGGQGSRTLRIPGAKDDGGWFLSGGVCEYITPQTAVFLWRGCADR